MKLLAFDVDGTVLDTLDSIFHQVNESLYENGFYRIDDKQYIRANLGYGSEHLIEKALMFPYNHTFDKNLTSKILDYYKKRYNSDPTYLTKPYDGMVSFLEEMKEEGYIMVAYSNKPDSVLQPLIKDLIPDHIFDYVLGNKDEYPAKPNPTVLKNILKKFNIDIDDACYIGDSEVDVQTGKNAAVKSIAVSWGFRDRDVLESSKPDYIVDSIEELRTTINRLNGN